MAYIFVFYGVKFIDITNLKLLFAALSTKDYKLLEHLKAFGTWDILLTLSEKGMLSNKEMFFDTMLKAINFSQSVFQGSYLSDEVKNNQNNDSNESPASNQYFCKRTKINL